MKKTLRSSKNTLIFFLLLQLPVLSVVAQDPCPLPADLTCQDQVNVNLDPATNTYVLTPQVVAFSRSPIDQCVYDQLSVFPTEFTCADVSSEGKNFLLLYTPDENTEEPLCFGKVIINDKIAPVLNNCPTSTQYYNLEPGTSLTLSAADFGITATDNCTANPVLSTDPNPFTISAANNGDTLGVDVIATDEYGATSRCRVLVTVNVSNCSIGQEAPTNLTITEQATEVVFTWDAVAGATAYTIGLEYFDDSNPNKPKWRSVKGLPPTVSATSFAVPLSQLDPALTHRFTVAVSGGNNCEAIQEFTLNNQLNLFGENTNMIRESGNFGSQIIQVFPNPLKDFLQIRFTEKAIDFRKIIQILDLNGHLLQEEFYSSDASRTQLNLSGLPAGIYILQAQDGKQVQSLKILKTN